MDGLTSITEPAAKGPYLELSPCTLPTVVQATHAFAREAAVPIIDSDDEGVMVASLKTRLFHTVDEEGKAE